MKWKLAISIFMKDLQFVQSEYNAHRLDPPPNRDLPPIVGKIAWSRQLYHRISQPIQIIQKQSELLKAPETRKAIKSFNKLAQVSQGGIETCFRAHLQYFLLFKQVLVEYELVHVRAWNKKLAQAQKSLNGSLLFRRAETQTLHVNFDPVISEVMREIDVMSQLEIAIPVNATVIRGRKEELKVKVTKMKVC